MKNTKYIDLAEILPHKAPMILIDRVLYYDLESRSLTAEFDVSEKSMFFDVSLGGVPSWVGLEYMAQTLAALSGIHGREIDGRKPRLGFLIGARRFLNNVGLYKVGGTYITETNELFFDNTLGSFQCSIIEPNGSICATAEINVFSPENPERFLVEGG